MKKFALICFVLTVLFTNSSLAQESAEEDGIHWMTFEEALEASEKEPKMWFIDMYTDWCGWCKRMDATTFKDSLITEEINANYYAVKFDAEQREDVLVGDSTYSFDPTIGRNGCHELAVQLLSGRMSYPSYVFLNANKQVLTVVPGYKVNTEMLPILQYCAEYDATNPVNYQSYMEEYESPYPQETED